MAKRKQTAIKVEGMREIMRDLRYLPKEQGDQLRRASFDIADTVGREAQGSAHTPQANALMRSVKAYRYRVPELGFGGNAKAGVSGGAKFTELLGANFGTNGRYPQFPARVTPDYYVWRTIKARSAWITERWMDAVGRALATVDPAARR